jgi:glycosyltransferase involved in cell wall biosynthesis
MIDFKDSSLPVVVITTETSWIEPPRMRHFITQQLSRKFNVIYFELDSSGFSKFSKSSDRLFIYKLGFLPRGVNRIAILRSFWDYVQALRISFFLKKLKLNKLVLLNFKFGFQRIYNLDIWTLKYFFINDDFINMPPNTTERLKEKKKIKLNEILNMCDRIFLSSEALLDYTQRQSFVYTVIHSGHDFKIKHTKNNNKTSNANIKLCLMGFINNNLEFDWIDYLLNFNFFEINFVGPIEDERIYLRYKKDIKVKFHPPLIGKNLQIFISKFDVMLMPYKPIEINLKASVPAKLFQYLACGKPVVSSIMPNLINIPEGFVYQSDNKFNFVDLIIKAFNEDNVELYNDRCKYASKHTWDSRGLLISNILNSDLKNKYHSF